MTIDWAAFTPWSALAGGLLIGGGAAMLLLVNGRVAGISGILGGLFRAASGDVAWRVAFIGGLVAAMATGRILDAYPAPEIDAGYPVLIAAGLLVGVGTRYAAGCTSGHGVCGIARLAPRSLVATMLFMAAGFATVYVVRHVLAS